MSWSPPDTTSSPAPPKPYTLRIFKSFVTKAVGSTVGPSPRIMEHYDSLSDDYLDQPMTADNVSDFVRRENNALFASKKPMTKMDKVAIAFTPFRAVAAHFVAQNAAIGKQGFFAPGDYQHEAIIGLLSDH
ncbi:hypothetical protein [Stenotrophomonas forensis]|uniref:hypothetical protein n=1 Tax=Stenotrophomonas forensis TaxID=2871169 RepID=UPI0018D2A10F|nr:hypothetical protein [Stenotrophomonas maltophilia]MBH1599221.1 hypothetical protein [Stenotrophomonas maltophilia]